MKLCGFDVGLDQRFFLIAGTCSIEGLQMSLDVAGQLKEVCTQLGVPLIYKGSFDKANRSSGASKRGVGIDAGLKILDEVRRQLQLPILTDVHDAAQVAEVASVVDVLQTPAFLCRQTDFIRAVAQSGKPVNIKKGQFLAPWDMKNVIDKARAGAAVGVAGFFMETHPKPAEAWSDGPNAVPLQHMRALLETLVALDTIAKKNGFLEDHFSA